MPHASPSTSNSKTLLCRYADTGDEVAFETLVGEFKNLVYATALRRLGSAPLAEEVTQTVFAIVARKAKSLQKVDHFAAWLHRTATQVASQTARTESRHRRKMKALIDETEIHSDNADDWCAIHPHLDEALEGLPERDRRIVMLRYYDGLSFREIAGQLGKSEAAAQRQGHRAVEKLARSLKRKGAATATVAILTAGLTTQFTTHAAASLATSSLTNAALASAPSIGGATLISNTVHTMSQIKTTSIAAAVLAIACVPLALQRSAIAEEKRKLTAIEQSLSADLATPMNGAPEAAANPSSARRPLSALRTRTDKSAAERLRALLPEFERFMLGDNLDEMVRVADFMNSLGSLSEVEITELLAEAQLISVENKRPEYVTDHLLETLYTQVAKTAPELALDSAMEIGFSRGAGALVGALVGFASHNPKGATDWFIATEATGSLSRKSVKKRGTLIHDLFTELFSADDAEAARLFAALPDDLDRREALDTQVQVVHSPQEQDRMISYALQISSDQERMKALAAYAQHMGLQNSLGEATADFVAHLSERAQLTPEQRADFYVAAARGFLPYKASGTPSRSREQALGWLGENSPPEYVERNLAKFRK